MNTNSTTTRDRLFDERQLELDHFEIQYGGGNLGRELRGMGGKLVVTDPRPWGLLGEACFGKEKDLTVWMPGTLDKAALEKMAVGIPEDVEIIGFGGGAVIDAAKYFAFLRESRPLLVPTITSCNAHFSDFISVRKDGSAYGFKKEGWPKRVIIDYDLIQQAEPRYNRAGFGDVLFLETSLRDWRLAAAAGRAVPVDPEVEAHITAMVDLAREHAAEIGTCNQAGLHLLMRLLEQSTFLCMQHLDMPFSAGSEHLFSWNLDIVTGRHLIHGETVALGVLISSFLRRSNFEELRHAFDESGICYLPDAIGVTWDEVREALVTLPDYNRRFRNFHTIFDEIEMDERLLCQVRDYIYEGV